MTHPFVSPLYRPGLNGPKSTAHEYLSFTLLLCLSDENLLEGGVGFGGLQMSVDQVKSTLSDFYGEIANASVKETPRGNDTIYEFQRRVGTKGSSMSND